MTFSTLQGSSFNATNMSGSTMSGSTLTFTSVYAMSTFSTAGTLMTYLSTIINGIPCKIPLYNL